MKKTLLLFFISSFAAIAFAQNLKSGFDKQEYIELLKITARQIDTPWTKVVIPAPAHYQFKYRSQVVGLKNLWDLWIGDNGTAVISIRGTTGESESWLENFHSAMLPATGKIQLSKSSLFTYKLSDDPKAAIHSGWLIGMASLSTDILEKMNDLYAKGTRDFIIMGHSQGGAIAFLLRSHLFYLQEQNLFPKDVRIKTYCSAAPKPGNLYYAYDYEYITRNGWGYTVINSSDWVPETPFSVQTISDFNEVNPFKDAKSGFKKQSFFVRYYLTLSYNKLNKKTTEARDEFIETLGYKTIPLVKKTLPELEEGPYANTVNFMRAGSMIVLKGDEGYFKNHPADSPKLFIHHYPEAYLYLAERLE